MRDDKYIGKYIGVDVHQSRVATAVRKSLRQVRDEIKH